MRLVLTLLLCWTIGTTTGCTPAPERPERTTWQNIEVPEPVQLSPVPLPVLPEISSETINGETRLVMSPDALVDLTAYKTASEANYEMLEATLTEAQALQAASESLIRAGRTEQELSIMRREMLEEERRAAFWERWMNRLLIVGLAVAAAL